MANQDRLFTGQEEDGLTSEIIYWHSENGVSRVVEVETNLPRRLYTVRQLIRSYRGVKSENEDCVIMTKEIWDEIGRVAGWLK